MTVKTLEHKCTSCGDDLTKKDSVVRKYYNTAYEGAYDDDNEPIDEEGTSFIEGRYDEEGNWDSDESLCGSSWDTYDGCDSCTSCHKTVG